MKHLISCILALVLLAGCTDNETFRVNGRIEGNPTLNLRVGYYVDGAYHTQILAAREGEFEFFGNARQPAVVTIFDYDYRPLTRIYARNGENYELTIDRANPYATKVSGNDISVAWADFISKNADSLKAGPLAANRVIANFISQNPANILSTILLTTQFNSAVQPALADSLLAMIAPEARPSALTDGFNELLHRVVAQNATDTIQPFRYLARDEKVDSFEFSDKITILIFSDASTRRNDSIVPFIRRHYKKTGIVDIGLDPIYGDWSRYTAPDSAKWSQGWMPGGPAASSVERLAIPSLPFIVVTDSVGAQKLRTPWVDVAENYLKNL